MTNILLAGAWVDSPEGTPTFNAWNPKTGEPIASAYPVTPLHQLQEMAAAGAEAALALETTDVERIARFLEEYASRLESKRDEICEMAHEETGLDLGMRLKEIEFKRTTSQLRKAAEAARDVSADSWRSLLIDESNNFRSCFGPLGGAVLTIGPNNFPLAFNGVSGGDFAAAIAAGNPVIAKGHPAHPGTSRMLAECAHQVVSEIGLHPSTVQFFFHCDHADGSQLIAASGVSAVGFTGSRKAGLSVKAAADAVGKPAYLEMSSVNPVFFLPGAVAERCSDIGMDWSMSLTVGAGQFCTKPGLAFAIGTDADAVAEATVARCMDIPDGVLFTNALVEEMADGIAAMQEVGASLLCGGTPSGSWGFLWPATLLRVDGDVFEEHYEVLSREVFGPTGLLIELRDLDQALRIARRLEGQLTACVYSGSSDAEACRAMLASLRNRCGRLLQNKMPTGVAVIPSMVHGGPFPATGHPGFTAVGMPTSISRFAARHCYDGIDSDCLPEFLR